jgi:hypothetical protein
MFQGFEGGELLLVKRFESLYLAQYLVRFGDNQSLLF